MRGIKQRYWCAKGQYEGKEPFYFGSVVLSESARHDEIMAAISEAWHKVFPFPPPPFEPLKGVILFSEDDEL